MNPPSDFPNPLLKSLADEAGDLPGLAAREARRVRASRAQRRRLLSSASMVVFLGMCTLQSWRHFRPTRTESGPQASAVQEMPPLAPAISEPAEYIKVQTVQEAITEPLPIPSGLTNEQRELLLAARGLPLLLVKDDSGKVVSIHVIER